MVSDDDAGICLQALVVRFPRRHTIFIPQQVEIVALRPHIINSWILPPLLLWLCFLYRAEYENMAFVVRAWYK